MLGIVLFGVLCQLHLLYTGYNVKYLHYRRDDLRYELRKRNSTAQNSFQSKWVGEMVRGLK